jgi:aspartate/methionine/tyrosine aminotransferase
MGDLNELVKKHRELDFLLSKASSGKHFISDWNCVHPFYLEHFENLEITKNEIKKYNYIRTNEHLTQLISDFHESNENLKFSLQEIITSNGTKTIISALFVWLKMQNITEVYYIPPVYFTFHYFASIYGIELRPITKSHLYEEKPTLNFPDKKSLLIVTDPIWYAGFSVDKKIINDIVDWQKKTMSTIIVDGSFQYFKWNCSKEENTSLFNKENTFRIICPSKIVATHGYRFSYLILPEKHYEDVDFILDNLSGSSNPYDIKFAIKCMEILTDEKSNNALIIHTKSIYERLLTDDIISSSIVPNAGYFIFAKLNKNNDKFSSMDGKYFEQERYTDYVRINLLSPAIKELF